MLLQECWCLVNHGKSSPGYLNWSYWRTERNMMISVSNTLWRNRNRAWIWEVSWTCLTVLVLKWTKPQKFEACPSWAGRLIFLALHFAMMSDWLFYRNQNLNVYDILFMPVLFLFSMCINRYTSAKQLQLCVTDTDVMHYGGLQKVQSCQNQSSTYYLAQQHFRRLCTPHRLQPTIHIKKN